MIKVKLVLIEGSLRRILGEKEVLFEISENRATIKGLLEEIAAKYGDKTLEVLLKPEISILLNGQYVEFLGGGDAKLSDGDRVAIIPSIAGG
ncbi:MAG: MoaD/ThiS family protein [Candidatus Bathyarchaeia archaeon]|nr:MoaD/ThiS family protein [Candidatus Bathyarchaeota archaeon]